MPPVRSRRSVLQLGATLSGLALSGCASTDGHVDTTTPRPDALSVGDSTEVQRGTVTVESIRAQRMFVGLMAGAHSEVYARPDTQYVLADVVTDDIADPTRTVRNALHLSLDSTRYDVVERYLTRNRRAEHETSVAFPIPASASVTAGELVWTGESSGQEISWTLPQDVLAVLAAPPEFTVAAFTVPATAGRGSSVEAATTVRNAGGSDGAFVAELGSTNLSDQSEIRVDVPAGESTTHSEEISLYGDPGSDETVVLDWGSETMERSVRIES